MFESYAAERSAKRQADRRRIDARVIRAIDSPALLRDPMTDSGAGPYAALWVVKLLLAAVAIHALILVAFFMVNQLTGNRSSHKVTERVSVQIVDVQPPTEPEEPLAADEQDAPTHPAVPEFQPKAPAVLKKAESKPAKQVAEPALETPAPTETAAPPPRYELGLNFESTVQGGKGPAMKTGESRMGTTPTIAAKPRQTTTERGGPTRSTGTGAGGIRQQRAASHIPTRDAVFVKPRRARPSKPPFPRTLKAQGIEGDVQVRVNLDATGHVIRVTVLTSSGYAAFDDAARKAALGEKFTPATRDGKAVPYALSYSYRFRIEEN